MKEVIILEVSGNKSQLVQDFLKQKKVDYRILIENQLELHNSSKKKEKKLSNDKEELEEAYRRCYTNNPHLLKEAKLWEQAGIETWLNREKGVYQDWNKPVKKVGKSTSKKATRTKWQ